MRKKILLRTIIFKSQNMKFLIKNKINYDKNMVRRLECEIKERDTSNVSDSLCYEW